MVTIVVHGNQVAELIEHKFMGVAQPGGKNFEITAIGFAAYDDALIGVVPVFALGVGHAHADITNAVINTPIGAQRYTGHAVTAESDMNEIGRASCRERV